MNSLLEDVNALDELLNNLQKIVSMVRNGHNVDAYRECNRVIAYVSKAKQELIANRNNNEK